MQLFSFVPKDRRQIFTFFCSFPVHSNWEEEEHSPERCVVGDGEYPLRSLNYRNCIIFFPREVDKTKSWCSKKCRHINTRQSEGIRIAKRTCIWHFYSYNFLLRLRCTLQNSSVKFWNMLVEMTGKKYFYISSQNKFWY